MVSATWVGNSYGEKLMGWHHNDLTAAAGAPLPAVNQSMSAYAFEHQGTQHVIYLGQDLHVEELWWDNNGWHHNDLTAAAGAPLPAVDQSMSAYAFEDQRTQHVIYLGQDLHVEELWWDNNGWHHNDLTAAAGAPLPAVNQSMSAYAFEDQGTQHVIYLGQDLHVEELWWDNNGWHHNDLTAAAGAPLPSVDESISAYAFEDQGTQHVIYVGQDSHINELWWDNNGWHHNDLTAATGAPLPGNGQSRSAYAFEDQGTQHVVYVGQDFHINELWWDNNGWHHNDLTAAASAPLPGVNQSMSAYAFEDQGTQHVIYNGQDPDIHELWWDNNGWHHNDLTAAAGAPLSGVNQSMSAYAFEDQGTQHVIYNGQDPDIHELWWAPD
jgi:hypothetical protein